MLKKFIAISLLSIYLISITELSQLVKLPLLIEHFSEHKQKDGHMSLWKFLSIHYTQNTSHDADYEKDMKLPFKSHDGCINSVVSESVPSSFYFFSTKPVFSQNNAYSNYTEQFLTSAYLSSIWQPPKSC
ncbi:MAG: hypothetical protein KA210_09265 [Bacteroidia bacterium]|jgi:hypothetical protein|nr:hypothetical protein [Bacteroidia bacterium]